jgi:hypothetical protein
MVSCNVGCDEDADNTKQTSQQPIIVDPPFSRGTGKKISRDNREGMDGMDNMDAMDTMVALSRRPYRPYRPYYYLRKSWNFVVN